MIRFSRLSLAFSALAALALSACGGSGGLPPSGSQISQARNGLSSTASGRASAWSTNDYDDDRVVAHLRLSVSNGGAAFAIAGDDEDEYRSSTAQTVAIAAFNLSCDGAATPAPTSTPVPVGGGAGAARSA